MASYSHLINHIEQVSFQYLLKAYMHIDRSLLVFRPGPIFNAYGPISLHMYLSIIWTHLSRHMDTSLLVLMPIWTHFTCF